MGPNFQYPGRDTQIWTPLTINPADFQTHTGYMHLAVARLKPGVTLDQVKNELTTIAARLAQQYQVKKFVSFGVAPLREDIASPAEKPLVILLAASFGLLLIGCCNLANLLLTRTLSRSREIAVRRALGASHYQLLLQALAEFFPLLLIGAILGLVAASWGINSLLQLIPATLPRTEEISINFPVMLFSVGLLIVTAAIVLIIPLYQMKRSDLIATLRQDSRTSTSSKTKIRNVLVVSQVALTVMLLTGAGLLIRTFAALKDVDPGFRSSGVLSLRLAIPRTKYKADLHVLVTPVLEAIRSVDSDQPAFAVRTMSEVVDQSISLRWFNAFIVSLFAGSSLLLAMVGVYGVIAWTVKHQTREIGVRIALGANRRAVLMMVLGKGLRMTAAGIGLGVLASFVLSRFLRSLLFGVTQTDPYTFIAVPTLLMVAATLACLLPALRAIRVDPITALKCE